MTLPHCRLRAPKCSPSRQAMAVHRGHAHWAHEFSTVLMQSMRAFSHIRYRRLMCACSSLSQRLTLTIPWLFLEKNKKALSTTKESDLLPQFCKPWQRSFEEEQILRSPKTTGICHPDPSSLLKRFSNTNSDDQESGESSTPVLSASD
jgi:hypothetical protein